MFMTRPYFNEWFMTYTWNSVHETSQLCASYCTNGTMDKCPDYQGVLISECPDFRGLNVCTLIPCKGTMDKCLKMSLLVRCPDFRSQMCVVRFSPFLAILYEMHRCGCTSVSAVFCYSQNEITYATAFVKEICCVYNSLRHDTGIHHHCGPDKLLIKPVSLAYTKMQKKLYLLYHCLTE